ncbi:helix-turn-helix transcriptional regulator [Streptococcus pneumoniae]
MRWDIGSIYKSIRTSKGLTQKEVCADRLSRSNLAKFESNRSIPSYETMEFLLRQLDMTFEEFDYICHFYQPSERQAIVNRVLNYTSSVDNDELQTLKNLCQDYLKREKNDIPIQNILRKAKIVLEVRQHSFSSRAQELANTAWKELEKRDVWYASDIHQIGSILFFFPIDTVQIIADRILLNLEKYKDYTNVKSMKTSLFLNLASIFFSHHRLQECEKVASLALESAKEQKRYDQLGLAQVLLGLCKDQLDLIDKGRQILELTGETTLLAQFQQQISEHHKKS